MHPLDGVRQKLVRAEEHLAPIKAEIETCLENCSVLSERDPDVNSRFHFTLSFPAPSLRLGVIIGECLYDLRSALDHIVWQLVLRNGVTPNHENMFPICLTPDGFARSVKKNRLRGVSVPAHALIESLQPYKTPATDTHLHPLWVLNQLMNIDKHRALTLAAIRSGKNDVSFIGEDGRIIEDGDRFITSKIPEILRDGTHVVIDAPDIPEPEKVSVQFKTQLFVAFEDAPVTDLEVNTIMNGVFKFVKNRLVPSFEPFF
jgi:hypothetical protein